MKKILFLVLIIIGLWYLFIYRDNTVKVATDNSPKQNETFRPDASNTTFTFDDESITLSSGKNETESGEETSILEYDAYGDLNDDDKQDTVVLIARSGGGSGIFVYAAAYVSGPVNYKGTNAVFLGDRIAPQNVSIQNGVATITYLNRGLDEPFAAEPTIKTVIQLEYKNGELVEK